MSIAILPSFFNWPNDVKDIWNIWKRDWSLKEQATLRCFVAGKPAFAWDRTQKSSKQNRVRKSI